jgi:hypothetical protein
MNKLTRKYVAVLVLVVLTLTAVGFALSRALITTNVQNAQALGSAAITLLPPVGPVQTPITVNGTGFASGASVNLYWFGYIASSHSLGYYPIKTGITAASDGTFLTTIIAPFDFGVNVLHNVNATQNGSGTGITNATFTIVPTMQLSPQPTKYKEGQEVFLRIFGAPAQGITVSPGPGAPPEVPILKFTYDNSYWGWIWSHIEPVPVATGFPTGDIGGNATIRFKATGASGLHVIRAYEGSIATIGPWLGCEIGGEVQLKIAGLEKGE